MAHFGDVPGMMYRYLSQKGEEVAMQGSPVDQLIRTVRAVSRRGFLAAGAVVGLAPRFRAQAACVPCAGQCLPLCGAHCPSFPPTCELFPSDHIWRARVDALPIHARSAAYIAHIGADQPMHMDFGSGLWDNGPIGIPMSVVSGDQPMSRVRFVEYGDESDPGPYRIPINALIEGGPCGTHDRHVLVVDADRCMLYELYHARPRKRRNRWQAGSGAIFDLSGYALRPEGWTSADAAGLPILPGLVRYEEIASGAIEHALRFTVEDAAGHVWPATHWEHSEETSNVPAMGHRFRLRADFDASGFSSTNQVIITALKRYGMMIADHGTNWYLSGVPDERWDNDDLHTLAVAIQGSDFECVDVSSLMISHDSGQVRTG